MYYKKIELSDMWFENMILALSEGCLDWWKER